MIDVHFKGGKGQRLAVQGEGLLPAGIVEDETGRAAFAGAGGDLHPGRQIGDEFQPGSFRRAAHYLVVQRLIAHCADVVHAAAAIVVAGDDGLTGEILAVVAGQNVRPLGLQHVAPLLA